MSKRQFIWDPDQRKDKPLDIVKWCRRNFGERGVGWDFYTSRGKVIIEIWNDRLEVIWLMWKE